MDAQEINASPESPFINKGEAFSIKGATPDFDASDVGVQACSGIDWYTRGVWYKLEGNGTNIRAEYQLYTYNAGDSELSVYKGSCGNLKCHANIKGWDDNKYNAKVNAAAVYEFYAERNEVYWFLLSGQTFNTAGK